MNRTEFVREVFLNDPRLIPSLLKDKSFDNKITKGILFKMLPFRSSIEIEACGDLTIESRIKRVKSGYYNPSKCFCKEIEKENGLRSYQQTNWIRIAEYSTLDFSPTFPYSLPTNVSEYLLAQQTQGEAPLKKILTLDDKIVISPSDIDKVKKNHINEFKISIKNYTQAVGLFKILERLKKEAFLNPQSGIHFHIDISDLGFINFKRNGCKIGKFWSKTYKEKIEPLLGKYTGEHNPALWGLVDKTTKINFSNYGSIEYRTGKMSFDYNTIMKQMVGLNQITKEFKKFALSLQK